MKLKKGFITHTVCGTHIMVAAGAEAVRFQGMVQSNETAAFIVDCLKDETTEDAIVDAILENYEAERSIVEKDVQDILSILRNIGAIE